MKREFGQNGEKIAAEHLQARGYTIVETNWRCSKGELDLVARHGDTLVFVEVRSRHSGSTEVPFESITPTKQRKLNVLAHLYLTSHDLNPPNWRIDVIAVAFPRRGTPIIEHVENALDW